MEINNKADYIAAVHDIEYWANIARIEKGRDATDGDGIMVQLAKEEILRIRLAMAVYIAEHSGELQWEKVSCAPCAS